MWQMYDNTHKYTLWGNQLFMKLDCAMYCNSPLAYYLHRLYKGHAGHLISNKRKQTCLQRHKYLTMMQSGNCINSLPRFEKLFSTFMLALETLLKCIEKAKTYNHIFIASNVWCSQFDTTLFLSSITKYRYIP